MSDGQQPPQVTPAKPQLQTPPVGSPVQGQVPPTQIPVTALAPPPGGGKKGIIIGLLVAVVGLGIWAMMAMNKDGDSSAEKKEEVVKDKVAPRKRAKPRKAEETTERPMKKEMVELSTKNRDKFKENVGKWVLLFGEVRSGNEEGVLEFKDPVGMKGQLIKGTAEYMSGKYVKVIGWMLTDRTIQIDGIFDVTFVDPVDLLSKKDVYTSADGPQLVALRNTEATFQGKVTEVRVSHSKKKFYLIFEGESHQFYGSGKIDKLKDAGVTEETLKELVGKTVKLKGELGYGSKLNRIYINFEEKKAYEVVE